MMAFVYMAKNIYIENMAILNKKGVDYICTYVLYGIQVQAMLNNFKLDNKGSLWIWTLVQMKDPLK